MRDNFAVVKEDKAFHDVEDKWRDEHVVELKILVRQDVL